jgi:transcription initiation factor IIE alpha subunit
VLRFGLEEVQPGQDRDNAARLVTELTDLRGILAALEEDGVIDPERVVAKRTQLTRFLRYSRDLGRVDGG